MIQEVDHLVIEKERIEVEAEEAIAVIAKVEKDLNQEIRKEVVEVTVMIEKVRFCWS